MNSSAVNPQNPTPEEYNAAMKIATSRYLAVAFLLGANKMRYGTLVEEIKNKGLCNKDNSSRSQTYPKTVAKSYNYLCDYKKDPKNLTQVLGNTDGNLNTGVAFTQEGAQEDGALM
jgi:hypothetical protein